MSIISYPGDLESSVCGLTSYCDDSAVLIASHRPSVLLMMDWQCMYVEQRSRVNVKVKRSVAGQSSHMYSTTALNHTSPSLPQLVVDVTVSQSTFRGSVICPSCSSVCGPDSCPSPGTLCLCVILSHFIALLSPANPQLMYTLPPISPPLSHPLSFSFSPLPLPLPLSPSSFALSPLSLCLPLLYCTQSQPLVQAMSRSFNQWESTPVQQEVQSLSHFSPFYY